MQIVCWSLTGAICCRVESLLVASIRRSLGLDVGGEGGGPATFVLEARFAEAHALASVPAVRLDNDSDATCTAQSPSLYSMKRCLIPRTSCSAAIFPSLRTHHRAAVPGSCRSTIRSDEQPYAVNRSNALQLPPRHWIFAALGYSPLVPAGRTAAQVMPWAWWA